MRVRASYTELSDEAVMPGQSAEMSRSSRRRFVRKRVIVFDIEVEVVREGILIDEPVRLWLDMGPEVVEGAVPELAADNGRSITVCLVSQSPPPCCRESGS
jgi:hypothetical protein